MARGGSPFGRYGRDSATTLNVPPFRSLELWRPRAGEGDDEAGRTVRFDPEFYETLIRHALPVDVRAARASAPPASLGACSRPSCLRATV